jgi:transposase-like protein
MHESLEKRTKELRLEVDRLGARRRGRRVPDALRRAIVEHAAACHEVGISWAETARGVGIAAWTLIQWRKDFPKSQRAAFLPVAVVEPPRQPHASLIVHGPAGLRIEGLALDGVVELIRRLG